jgi:mannose-6-phosphate isomerase-like protein (cupin superfamily)
VADRWTSVRIDEIEPIAVDDGKLLWRPLRRALGVEAFGINAYVAPNAGDDVVEEHTEEQYRHEEVYLVLSGRATFTLDGEPLDAPAGCAVFVRDPAVKRHARAEEPGTAVLAIGGPRGQAYAVSPWETWFAAYRHRETGQFEEMVTEMQAGLDQHGEHPALLYHLACAEALAGRSDDAVVHLSRAVELASIRDLPGFPP